MKLTPVSFHNHCISTIY